MSKHLANVTGKPLTPDYQLHRRTKPEPQSPASIVEPSIPQSKSNAQPGANPVAVVVCETILPMFVAKLRRKTFMP